MSKKYLHITFGMLIAVMFACSSSLMAQTGWYPLQSGTLNSLKSVYFLDSQVGYMSGNGIMLKTFNGGTNWVVIFTAFNGSPIV
ncbi:MAG TPA: hypothetical protein PKA39_06175, partial [Ignavibacteria bacterium]|nr:hypothetical protein [Ignavibacteria bacterium]